MAETAEKKISKSQNYDTSTGVLKRKAKFCPKCGPGVFLAAHKDRNACGKCGYMEKK
jgi:small subunit ribosomal protein S27Ae